MFTHKILIIPKIGAIWVIAPNLQVSYQVDRCQIRLFHLY